jgi:hypothetical protein
MIVILVYFTLENYYARYANPNKPPFGNQMVHAWNEYP